MTLKAAGLSTADLESQRDVALQSVSQIVDAKVLAQENGNVVLVTGSGLSLPIEAKNPFSTSVATVGPGAYYPGGGLPGITLGGADVTAQISGGRLGANLTLRDTTMPTYQGELDEFAHGLASRFDAQGLRLFSDPSGNVPAGGGAPVQSGYVGFASAIGVNPAVEEGGVSIDTEMSTMVQLQNAYGASARLISAAQAMWTQLLSSVQ